MPYQSNSDNNTETVDVRKQNLRRQVRALRAAMSEAQRAAAASRICNHLQQIITRLRMKQKLDSEFVVAVYLAKREEVCLDDLVLTLLEQGVPIVAPVGGAPSDAPFYRLHNLTDGITIGSFDVREPMQYAEEMAFSPAQVQLVLAPGLAFDRQGGRLGYGGGWYDQILGEVPCSIGVCFDCQLVGEVPCKPHDRRVGAIVTETQTIITGVSTQLLEF
ncbi:MAG: 5-formyltetrahydrofolate cyclo-ligase [Abitibacteriaceae bacterium]|nr:5-formyltetrahydrofolate cyclo-ligase [Abditibacteriaceae bacterium]MBV9867649.1 5-formyltetrahydrofolate cyclo-ligase [Abditibacteriaceae bacterium]